MKLRSNTKQITNKYYISMIDLTGYCREEFEKFITFLTSKGAEIGQFSGETSQFSRNSRLVVCNDRYTSAVIG